MELIIGKQYVVKDFAHSCIGKAVVTITNIANGRVHYQYDHERQKKANELYIETFVADFVPYQP